MKKILFMTFALSLLLVLCKISNAWENELTHPAITEEAANPNISKMDEYLKKQLGFNDGLLTQLYWDFPSDIKNRMVKNSKVAPTKTKTILDWLRTGSTIEDEDGAWKPIRPRHHFLDPTRNLGLNNQTDHPEWNQYASSWTGFNFMGSSALTWAITGNSPFEPYNNHDKWQTSRNIFYHALTKSNKAERDASLAESLMKLGCVSHLLEDMGVPAHTRNDFLFGHYRSWYAYGNDFENDVEEYIALNKSFPWLGTAPVAFDSIDKYLDSDCYTMTTDLYLYPETHYIAPSDPQLSQWGLSERTNYQFLSFSTVFGCSGSLYQFPHPHPDHVTDVTEPVDEGELMYFQGYEVAHLAQESFTYHVVGVDIYPTMPTLPNIIIYTNTTNDPRVSSDYADITIPRTIDYAAGLLNYFFRGKLKIEATCIDCENITFNIRNLSKNSTVNQTLKGGTFELFWDHRNGTRTKVEDFTIPGWNSSSTLGYDQVVTGTFTKPPSDKIEKYIVVYKGQISQNPGPPDNDDSSAIAVGTIAAGYPIIAWGRNSYGQVSDVPEGNDYVDVAAGKYHCVAIKSDGSLVAWGSNDHGQCDVPQGNDFIAISGGKWHSIALREDGSLVGFGDNTFGQTTVPSGTNFIAIASGDNHNLAIKNDGTIVGWGYNYHGECDAPPPDTGTTYVAVSAATYHSLALQSDGTVKAWGYDYYGATRIYAGARNDHEAVAAGFNYSFLLLTDNSLVNWGGGDWIDPPANTIPDYHWKLPEGNNYIAIAAGLYHIAALTDDGRILLWGYDNYNLPPDETRPVPSGVIFRKDITAGYNFTVALKER